MELRGIYYRFFWILGVLYYTWNEKNFSHFLIENLIVGLLKYFLYLVRPQLSLFMVKVNYIIIK